MLGLLERDLRGEIMKSLKSRAAILVMTLVLISGLGLPAAAQQEADPAGSGNNELVVRANELQKSIEEKSQELDRLEAEIASASGQDKEALQARASELGIEAVDEVWALAGNVVAREDEGLDATADRERVAAMLERVSEIIRAAIDRLRAELAGSREQLAETASGETAEIEDQIVALTERLDRALNILLGHIDATESFGLEAKSEREFLEAVLMERSGLLAGRIAVVQKDLAALDRRIKASPDDTALTASRELAQQKLEGHVASLETAAGMMESLGLDAAEYRQLLFEVTGEITTDLMSREVVTGLISKWTSGAGDWVVDRGPRLFFQVVLFLLILLLFKFLARIARKVVKKAINTSTLQVSTLLERTALSVTGTVVMIVGVLVALSQLGFEVGPLLAGFGVVGFIVGFALQDTLGNFAAGVMILLYRPYDVGDLIETAGVTGKVSDMSLVATTILTLDHQTLVIPNSKIWGDVIKNVTAQTVRRVDMVFGIAYSDDIPHAERVLEKILNDCELVLEDPEPIVKLHNLGESSVDFIVRPWVETDEYWNAYWHVTREVKIRFDAEGISIPFPQRDVHIFKEGSEGDA
jgi:small conductance mechanosensitive channel